MRTHILRLARTDQNGEHVLLNVSQSGSKPLNLKLIATEQEHLYHATIQQSKLDALRAKAYGGSDEEWEAVLKHVLLRERADNVDPSILQGVEAVANISGHATTVTIRKNIGGVIQRLGSFKLDEDDAREEVSFPEWVETAVMSADELRAELETALASLQTQNREAARLNALLDELVQAKAQHEEELLKKFAALLNSKKLKIRDQQRLLAAAKVNETAAATIAASRSKAGPRVPAPAQDQVDRRVGGRKRRNSSPAADVAMSDDTNDSDENAAAAQETPEPSDLDAGESDGEDGVEVAEKTSSSHGKPSAKASSTRNAPSKSEVAASPMDDETDDEL